MLLCYASHDGHSRRIAARLAARLNAYGLEVKPRNLHRHSPTDAEMEAADLLTVVVAVRYGRHLDEAERLLRRYAKLRSPPRLALASVNLTARKPHKTSAAENPYLRKWIARHRLQPALATAFAGRLDYPAYAWWERQAIRLIMSLTGGETDPTASREYTAWPAVDAFADALAAAAGASARPRRPSEDAAEVP